MFAELLASYGVKSCDTTAKKAQANANVERIHVTINNKVGTMALEYGDDWNSTL